MNSIITTTEVQKNIGKITNSIDKTNYIVTNHGKGKIIMLPYFEGCDEYMADFREDYEMMQNQAALQKRYQASLESGKSDLVI